MRTAWREKRCLVITFFDTPTFQFIRLKNNGVIPHDGVGCGRDNTFGLPQETLPCERTQSVRSVFLFELKNRVRFVAVGMRVPVREFLTNREFAVRVLERRLQMWLSIVFSQYWKIWTLSNRIPNIGWCCWRLNRICRNFPLNVYGLMKRAFYNF